MSVVDDTLIAAEVPRVEAVDGQGGDDSVHLRCFGNGVVSGV